MAPIMCSRQSLSANWSFKQGSLDSTPAYLPANNAPTEIHRDLLKNGKISDPFQDLNELSVRWIAEESWTYRTTFSSPEGHGKPDVRTELVFEGLDTFASGYLNGQKILESDNMFLAHRIDVSSLLHKDSASQNVLEIVFDSARKRGLELVERHPEHQFIVHQTEVSRGPVRKAQYQWGWDWGPILLTCGPWKPVYLETYTSRIEDVWVEYQLNGDLKTATGKISAKIEGPKGRVEFEFKKAGADDVVLSGLEGKRTNYQGVYVADFEVDVDLWWPRGYGLQNLYSVSANLIAEDGAVVHRSSKPVGFRTVKLVQEKDAFGQSFYFRVNNTDIFAGGSCWIPADNFLSRITPESYRDWMKLAAEGNQIMVRIWGGGIYESDEFYHACDEFGLLVWQDFMFACASYPTYPAYLKSVEEEARQNVRRLRNHPSIIIWAGNNEDYQIAERYGLEYRFIEDKDPKSWLKTNFPARYLYEYLLPKIVQEEIKGVPYHPSSPFGSGISTVLKVDPTVGDIHQWNVWHGEMKPYQMLPQMGGRFVSEFGMEAYPHLETIEGSITEEEDRYPGSMAMDFRNKAIGHERRLVSYVAENFQIKYDLPSFTHLTQVMQADTIYWAYKCWRRQWGTPGNRKCGGVLVWQLNDCWPTMSWAVVDYYSVPKPAYYMIKRAMEPVAIGVARRFHNWTMRPADDLWKRDTSHIDMRQVWEDVQFDVWISSARVDPLDGEVSIKFISIRTGKEIQESLKQAVTVEPNGTTDVIRDLKVELPQTQDANTPFETAKADPFVIHVSLSIDGREVATDSSWPDPIKYLKFPDRGVTVEPATDGKSITVSATKPVKAFVFSERQGVKLGDNGFDLMPGQSKTVVVERGGANEFKWRYIGM
ncbi:glycoside hydrolase family 2 protein [Zopfia rhizophila CBS 207.26]|uniref:Beta-mannosidase n=1 Tax=Zopfia rhizophila CBS 207.26 TaxID=1314779 RepID=A0A6A6ESL4_9PEZI|nr:glycoside hydrolase family 2 protein [Zopfia rhizophila CBS 207.26]